MHQMITEDDDGCTAIEFDEEGGEYLIDGLRAALEEEVGHVFTTPSFWKESRKWWQFWKPKERLISGELRLRRVESDAA